MGLWKHSKAFLTAGASTKLIERTEDHELIRQTLNLAVLDVATAYSAMAPHMRLLGRTKQSALGSIKTIRTFSRFRLDSPHADNSGMKFTCRSYEILTKVVADYEAALAAFGGLGSGTLASIGAWSLVATFGTASTGTAIGGLAGAAVTKATLAWFGGGALAAGGGGMALGTAVLGGIVFAPAALFGIWKLNTGIRDRLKQVDCEIASMQQELCRARASIAIYERAPERIRNIESSIHAIHSRYLEQWIEFRRAVLVVPFVSHIYRWCRVRLGGQFFSFHELVALEKVERSAVLLASSMSQQIFDSQGFVCSAGPSSPDGEWEQSLRDYDERLRRNERPRFTVPMETIVWVTISICALFLIFWNFRTS